MYVQRVWHTRTRPVLSSSCDLDSPRPRMGRLFGWFVPHNEETIPFFHISGFERNEQYMYYFKLSSQCFGANMTYWMSLRLKSAIPKKGMII